MSALPPLLRRRLIQLGSALLIALALLALAIAVAISPTCKPGDPGIVLGGVVVLAGCPR